MSYQEDITRLEARFRTAEENLWKNVWALANRIVELEAELQALKEGAK
jgi:hypothetical protein